MSTGDDGQRLARALAFIQRTLELIADDVRQIDSGLVVRSASLPAVWAANQLLISNAPPFAELVALADEQLAERPYRHIQIIDQSAGPQLEQQFRTAGWRIERELLMALEHGPDRRVDTSGVIPADEGQLLELMRRWHLEASPQPGRDEVRQVLEFAQREGRARTNLGFGVAASDTGLVAMTKLRTAEGVAQVEDVYTVPEARGRGYARALVTYVTDEARRGAHELIFIVADDAGWPKRLYNRLGFEPIGHMWAAHHRPAHPGD